VCVSTVCLEPVSLLRVSCESLASLCAPTDLMLLVVAAEVEGRGHSVGLGGVIGNIG